MIELREITHDEYLNSLKEELKEIGLYKPIHKRCDEIYGEISNTDMKRYPNFMHVIEMLNEIDDLAFIAEGMKEDEL